MHGHFYTNPHYQRPPQETSSSARNISELAQTRSHYSAQQAALSNGQVYQGHGGQHLPHQRLHQIFHPPEYSQSPYSIPPELFSQALHQQQQNISNARQHQRIQQLEAASASDHAVRSLLNSSSPALQQFQLNQLRHSALSSRPLAVNVPPDRLQHQPTQPGSRYLDESSRSHSERREQEAALTRSRSQTGLQNIRSISQAQSLLNSVVPSPSIYHNPSNANYMHGMILSSPTNPSGMTSPNRTIYSPVRPHATSQSHSSHPARSDLNSGLQYSNYQTMTRSTSQDLQSPKQTTLTGGSSGVTLTDVHVKRQTWSVNSSTAPVIIVDSDDDDDETFMTEQQTLRHQQMKSEMPRRPKETVEDSKTDFTPVFIDDDIAITGFKEAEIMSHMRPDCPIHKFDRVDIVSGGPYGKNAAKCTKCYCYVCDKPANDCSQWSTSVPPHCNAHAKASCWKARRNVKKSPLISKLPNDEITREMTESGEMSLQYMIRIREQYITYRNGIPCEYHRVPCDCQCHKTARSAREDPCINCKAIHDAKKSFNYEPVREIALTIIREIRSKYQDRPITALIALEAVLSELCSQRPADFNHCTRRQSNPDLRCQCNFPGIIEDHIETEMIVLLTRFEVPSFFLEALKKSVEEAVKPLQLEKIMKKFMAMKHWDDLLLRAVISGSNSTGVKGREHLRETPEIIRSRIEKLYREKKYLAVIRYLKTVKIHQIGTKDTTILSEMERWKMICSAHQGRFKEVTVQLMDIFPRKNGVTHEQYPMEFILKLLDALTDEDPTRDVRIDFFEWKSSDDHKVTGRDADIVVLVTLLVLHQTNLQARDKVSLILWLAKWVNRAPLFTSLDPTNTRRWLEEGGQLIELANRSMATGNAQSLLQMLGTRDPHVHLLTASMCIMNIVTRYPASIQAEHRQEILNCYKNNEWALFLLVTQAQMMNFHDPNILRWITSFCDTHSGVIGQIQESVVVEAIKYYPLDVLTEFLAALIRPGWTSSIPPIQRTIIRLLSEYSMRLFHEMPQIPKDVLRPKADWIEERVIKPFLEQELLVPHDLEYTFKGIIKTSCFLNPAKPIIELSRRILANEWPKHCEKIIRLLADKFKKFTSSPDSAKHSRCMESSGTMDEFSLLLWLLWISNGIQDFASYSFYFQDHHSCEDTEHGVTSSKIPDEIAKLLDSTTDENFYQMKLDLLECSRRLCVVETLSWLTCTGCATKMPTHWSRVWISTAKSRIPTALNSLIASMLSQFKEWLNKISFDVPECYDRLLKCLQTFLHNLVTTWQRCAIPLEEARRLLLEVSNVVVDRKFNGDLVEMGNGIIEAELAKLRPKVTQAPVQPQPVNQPQLTHRPPEPSPRILKAPTKPPPSPHALPPKQVLPLKPPPTKKPGKDRPNLTLRTGLQNSVELPQKQTPIPSSLASLKNGPVKESEAKLPVYSKPTQNAEIQLKNSKPPPTDEGEPFSPLNLSRTKPCPNCKVTISCATFRCPHCNKPTRSKQPVICPGCNQENLEVKKYSCEFCYRSLIDVMVLRTPTSDPKLTSDPKPAEKPQKEAPQQLGKVKKKAADKRRKKSKNEEIKSTATISTSEEVTVSAPTSKKRPKNWPKKSLASENSDSSLDDFVPEPPKKIAKMSPKIRPNFPKPAPVIHPTPPQKSFGGSLTDSDSDSSSDDSADSLPKIMSHQNKPQQDPRPLLPNKVIPPPVRLTYEKEKPPHVNQTLSTVKPVFHNRTPRQEEPRQFQKLAKTQPVQPPIQSGLKKRGVGHSSAMSKNQKKLLSRFRKNGKGTTKFSPTQRTVNKLKDSPKILAQPKPSPLLEPSASMGNHTERLHNDTSLHGNTAASPSGLSFSLAKVRLRNVGHRTGGRPRHREKAAPLKEENEALLPKALNDIGTHSKSKKKSKKRDIAKRPKSNKMWRLEKKLRSLMAKRKPGPASRSNYRKLVTLERKLRKLRRPHKLWNVSPRIKLPQFSDLSVYMIVSLSPFPNDKLKRIQSLTPYYKLKNLYA